jgi:hypothetical protein
MVARVAGKEIRGQNEKLFVPKPRWWFAVGGAKVRVKNVKVCEGKWHHRQMAGTEVTRRIGLEPNRARLFTDMRTCRHRAKNVGGASAPRLLERRTGA